MKKTAKDYLNIISIVLCIVILFIIPKGTTEVTASEIKDIEKVEIQSEPDLSLDTLTALSRAFAMVESSNNPDTINKRSGASGLHQMKEIMVREVNRILNIINGTNNVWYYTYEDRFDSVKSCEMFAIAMNYHNPTYDIKKACTFWNYTHSNRYYKNICAYFDEYLKEQMI